MTVAGVDVSDPTRNFNREEYSKLIDAGYITTLKARRRESYSNSQRQISTVQADGTPTDTTPPSNGGNFGSGAYDRPQKKAKQE